MSHGMDSSCTGTGGMRHPWNAEVFHEVFQGIENMLGRALDAWFMWSERLRERRALDAMPDYLLHDMGISRADVEREVEKPFWRS